MLHFIANGLVAAAIILQFLALRPVRRLIALLPPGRLRFSWYVLPALIIIFIIVYGAYIPAFWGSHENLSDLVVPAVFFLGACFVLLVNILSLETSGNVRRLIAFEQESITDPLTGIHNRPYLARRLAQEIARSRPGKTAIDLAERLRKVVEKATFEVPVELERDIRALGVTVSIGVACFSQQTKDMQDLIQNADKALYRAKSEGRNRVVTGSTTDA